MKYLIFTRPFTKNFTDLYKIALNKNKNIVFYASDFKYKDDVKLIEKLYANLDSLKDVESHWNSDLDEIIFRCRYLRNIDVKLAKRLVISAKHAISEILEELKPDIYIGLPIDNYILHIFHLQCNERGIKNISPVQSFLPDRTRITSLGEWIKVRDVDQAEVEKYYEIITDKIFKPTWLKPHRSYTTLVKLYAKERMKKIYFELLKIIKQDPYSFHYNTIFPAKGVISIDSIKNIFAYKYYQLASATEKLIENKDGRKKIVYLPLQFSPETTIDYYIQDYRFGRYEELIRRVVNATPCDVTLVIKEHPDLYGFRNPEFYAPLLASNNVHLAGVDFPSSRILQHVDAVIVTGAGSTGAEAIIRGIRTLSLGGAFYSGIESMSINNFDQIERWPEVLEYPSPEINSSKIILRRILENTIEGPYDFVRPSKRNRTRDIENIKKIIHMMS